MAAIPDVLRLVFVILAGGCVGSFLNVCIHRLPRGLSVVRPRSACPSCGRPIAWYDNLPVLSWMLLRGRCRGCRAPIAMRYPIVEGVTAALFGLLYARLGATPLFLVEAIFAAALVALIVIDAEHQILPNAITLPGILVGLATSPLRSGPHPLGDACLGAVAGFAILFATNAGYRLWQAARGVPADKREDGIGQGDFKLLAMIGAFLGVRLVLFSLFVGAVAGAAYGVTMIAFGGYGWKSKLPYGVFLGSAAILALFVGETWVGWYVGLAGIAP